MPRFGRNPQVLAALALLFAIGLTPLGPWMASTLPGHVLGQIPLLFAAGWILGRQLEGRVHILSGRWNAGGIAGILTASVTLAFWMIPRWLDASVNDGTIAATKYASLVLLAGVPAAWSWNRLHPIARGLVKIEFLSMLFRLGWLYLISPERLCNNYLLSDQVWLGQGMLIIAIALSITWLIPVFFGDYVSPDPESVGGRRKLGDNAA